ncbi:MAG: hypothetical protein AAGH83_00565 [Pseudomonadota bacterium]
MKFFDLQVPFFRPLWIRILVTVLCLAWALVELSAGAVFWAVLFAVIGLYCAYQFFVVFDPKDPDAEDEG